MTARISPAASAMTVGAVTAAGATHLAVDLVSGGFAALLPTIAERLSLSSTGAGALVALFSVSALGSQPLMGGLADRFDARHVTAITAGVAAAVLAAATVVTSLLVLVAVIVVGGLASAAFHPAGATLARRYSPASPENAVAVFAAAGTVGLALGPIAVLALADGAAQARALLLAVPALLIAPVIWRRSPVSVPNQILPRTGRSARSVLLHGEVPKLAAAATLVAIAWTSIASTLPLWIADQPGRDTTEPAIGWALATFALAAAAGGVIAGRLTNHVGSARLLRLSLLAAAIPTSALALVTPATAASFVALFLTGLLIGPAIPLLLVAAQNEAPERAATASGMIMGLSHGLAGVAFIGVSVIISTAGYGAGVLTGAVALVPAAFIVGTRDSAVSPTIADTARCVIATCRCIVDRPDPARRLVA
ncbi:MAG: MFS transporter [Actinomycetota bacterium]|nr:MFS transporter [Actinomycetota bacterium]